jgi:hypothetical protein
MTNRSRRRDSQVTLAEAAALLAKSFDLDEGWMTKEQYEADRYAEFKAEQEAENAWLRHAENAGWMEAEAERLWEDRRGVIQFDEALHAALGY